MENIRVVLRVKPLLSTDKGAKDFTCLQASQNGKYLEVKVDPLKIEKYRCHRCFGDTVRQEEFYQDCGVIDLLENSLRGSPVCTFVFGESGSGKSHTLFGHQTSGGANERSAGIIPRSIKHLIETLTESGTRFQLRLTCVEIVSEAVFDLLADQSSGPVSLMVLETEHGEHVLHNATCVDCTRYDAALEVLEQVSRQRATQQQAGRRSHCLVQLSVQVASQGGDSMMPLGAVSFVDLVDSDGLRMDNNNITDQYDHSLYVLSKVIDGIERANNDNTGVTDSVLTSLLSQCIGIHSRCLLISCVHQGRFHLPETLKTLKFSCAPIPKLPKYLDPQAKLVFDLKHELHYLNRQNHRLRDTMITAPTWELHSLSHASSQSKRQEAKEEKALIEMHQSIIRANETYKFKPRGGGRMYFPSPVAGRPLPLRPQPSVDEVFRCVRSGTPLEGLSHFSSLFGGASTLTMESTDAPAGLLPTQAPNELSPSPSKRLGSRLEQLSHRSQGHSRSPSASRATRPGITGKSGTPDRQKSELEDLLRHTGPPGLMVFRAHSPASAEPGMKSVAELKPIRETTQLGFGRESLPVPLLDWEVEVRRRVARAEHNVATGRGNNSSVSAKAKQQANRGVHKKFLNEDLLHSPFVAHLVSKPAEKREEKPNFQIRINVLDSPLNPVRPGTTSHTARPQGQGQGPPVEAGHGRRRPKTSDSQRKAQELLALVKQQRKRGNSAASSQVASRVPSRPASADTQQLLSHSFDTLSTASHDSADAAHVRPEAPEEAPVSPVVVGFNPRKPSVFAASLHSDQSNVIRRQSTFSSIESFTSRVLHRDHSISTLAAASEDTGLAVRERALAPLARSGSLLRQRSERMQLSRGLSTNTIGEASTPHSKTSSSSTLLSADRGAAALSRQKSRSIIQ